MKSSLMRRSILAVPLVTAATWTGFAMAQGAPPPPAAPPAAPPAPPAAAPAPPAAAAARPPRPPRPRSEVVREGRKVEGFPTPTRISISTLPKPQTGTNPARAFDVSNGFALHWAGSNASYAPDPAAHSVGLRFGPGAGIYNTGVDNQISLTYEASVRGVEAGRRSARARLRQASTPGSAPRSPTPSTT